ncbi:MAG: DMT family transporter, partial [Hyphomicrobiales bacterium]|nr:DMT family transporter [Hyphomicrobiales bacterium]
TQPAVAARPRSRPAAGRQRHLADMLQRPLNMSAVLPNSAAAGITVMVVAMLVVPTMDTLAKILSQTMPALEITFARSVIQTVLAFLTALLLGQRIEILPARFGLHLLRSTCLAFAILFFFAAIKAMPIADALAIYFIEPMILTALSAVVLGERVGLPRWGAVLVGFVGALFIVQPGVEVFGVRALLPLGTAVFIAVYLLLTRFLSGTASALTLMFGTGLHGSILLGSLLALTTYFGIEGQIARVPMAMDMVMLIGVGTIGFVCHLLLVLAFARAPSSILAPLGYLEIVSATLLGYFVFNDFPAPLTWLGVVLIVGSGLFIIYREQRAAPKLVA